jgi:hypothetical protein
MMVLLSGYPENTGWLQPMHCYCCEKRIIGETCVQAVTIANFPDTR